MKKTLFSILLALSPITTLFAQLSWTNESPAGLSDDIWCVQYANDTFVAVTGKGKVLSSTDGSSWTTQTISQGTWMVSIAYGLDLWVAVGENGSVFYSADLKQWNSSRAFTTSRLNGVAFTGKTFIAVGEGGVIATSTNAQTWTVANSGTTNFLHGILARSGQTIVTGGKGTVLSSSNEGASWSDYKNSLLGYGTLSTSVSDIEVIATAPFTVGSPNAIVAGSAGFVSPFVTYNSGSSYYNYNSSTIQYLKPPVVFRGLAYGGDSWVLVGENGSLFTSKDALKWTQRFTGDGPDSVTSATLLSVAYSSTLSKFVIVGTGGTIITSSTPPTSFVNVATRGTVVTSDPLIGGFVISGNAQKKVLIRGVGPTLGQFGVGNVLADPVITLYDKNNKVVATNAGWTTNSNLTTLVAATLRCTFPLTANSKDAALYVTLDAGSYTVVVTSTSKSSGTVLFEAYSL